MHWCLFSPAASKAPFREATLKLLLLLLQKAIAWKKMSEWYFEFLEGPITETQPMEQRQLASGAKTWWQTGGWGEGVQKGKENEGELQ